MAVWKDERLYAVHQVHLDAVTEILQFLCLGEKIEALKVLQRIVKEARYGSGCITQSLAMDALRGPQHFGNVFTSDEWSELIDELVECTDYYQVVGWMGKYGDMAASRMGGF